MNNNLLLAIDKDTVTYKILRKLFKDTGVSVASLPIDKPIALTMPKWLRTLDKDSKSLIIMDDKFSQYEKQIQAVYRKFPNSVLLINISESKEISDFANLKLTEEIVDLKEIVEFHFVGIKFTNSLDNLLINGKKMTAKAANLKKEDKSVIEEDEFGLPILPPLEKESDIKESIIDQSDSELKEDIFDIDALLENSSSGAEEESPPTPLPLPHSKKKPKTASFSIIDEMAAEKERFEEEERKRKLEEEIQESNNFHFSENPEGVMILVTARKGGVGKTTTAANLAVTLGSYMPDKTVVLLDGSAGQSDQRIYYEGWSDTNKGIANIVRSGSMSDIQAVTENLVPFGTFRSNNIWVLHGLRTEVKANEMDESIVIPQLREIVETLKSSVDYIVVDSPVAEAARKEFIDAYIPKADYIVAIVTQNKAALKHIKEWVFKITSITGEFKYPKERIGYLINREQAHSKISPRDIRSQMPSDVRYLETFPESPIWLTAQEEGNFLLGTMFEPLLRKVLFSIINEPRLDANNDEIEETNFIQNILSKLGKAKDDSNINQKRKRKDITYYDNKTEDSDWPEDDEYGDHQDEESAHEEKTNKKSRFSLIKKKKKIKEEDSISTFENLDQIDELDEMDALLREEMDL